MSPMHLVSGICGAIGVVIMGSLLATQKQASSNERKRWVGLLAGGVAIVVMTFLAGCATRPPAKPAAIHTDATPALALEVIRPPDREGFRPLVVVCGNQVLVSVDEHGVVLIAGGTNDDELTVSREAWAIRAGARPPCAGTSQ